MTLQFVSNDEFDTGRVTRWVGEDIDNRFFSMYIYISQVHKLLPKVMKLSPARGGLPDQWVSLSPILQSLKNSFSFFPFFFFLSSSLFLSLPLSSSLFLSLSFCFSVSLSVLKSLFCDFLLSGRAEHPLSKE